MGRQAKTLTLTEEERNFLRSMTKKGTHKARKITRARALLMMDAGNSAKAIQTALGIDHNNYYKLKRRYFSGGLVRALEELPRSGQPRKVDARLEAHITSLACSKAPEGRTRWTLSLLRDKLVELAYVSDISKEAVRRVLKKVNSNLG